MAYDKKYPEIDDEILAFDKGQEDRLEDQFNKIEDKTKAGFEMITPTDESSISIGGTKFYTGSKRVLFKTPFVGRAPSVTATVNTTGSHFMNVGVTAVGRDGFTLNINRINQMETGVYWVATQPTE